MFSSEDKRQEGKRKREEEDWTDDQDQTRQEPKVNGPYSVRSPILTRPETAPTTVSYLSNHEARQSLRTSSATTTLYSFHPYACRIF
jgi:hypothetical protein